MPPYAKNCSICFFVKKWQYPLTKGNNSGCRENNFTFTKLYDYERYRTISVLLRTLALGA